jgi:D-glycero-D-manno-heptose 1,7-bisphosphate phosphatase
MNKAIFLDRDGIINKNPEVGEYIRRIDQFEFIEGISELILFFRRKGYLIFVITNQRGVALKRLNLDEINNLHQHMANSLNKVGAKIDKIYFCPHDEGECNCRKPKPGMVLDAASKFQIDLKCSIVIGDSWRDIELANCLNMTSVYIGEDSLKSTYKFNSLMDMLDYFSINNE